MPQTKSPPSPVPVSKQEAEDFYDRCDLNHDGKVTIDELQKVLCRNGIASIRVAQMFVDIDKDNSKSITKKEFVDDVCAPQRSKAIEETFRKIDKDRSGYVDAHELVQGLLSYGFKDVECMKIVFEKADVDQDGKIDLQEFKNAMQRIY